MSCGHEFDGLGDCPKCYEDELVKLNEFTLDELIELKNGLEWSLDQDQPKNYTICEDLKDKINIVISHKQRK